MKTRALNVALLVLALIAGAAFAIGHDDHPCTGDDHDSTECTCESECDDCACDSLSRAKETSAPIEGIEETGCRGCPGQGCR